MLPENCLEGKSVATKHEKFAFLEREWSDVEQNVVIDFGKEHEQRCIKANDNVLIISVNTHVVDEISLFCMFFSFNFTFS